MHVNLLDYTSGEKRIAAVITVENGELLVQGEVSHRILNTIRLEHAQTQGDEAFLRKLPQIFSGTYTRAQLIED